MDGEVRRIRARGLVAGFALLPAVVFAATNAYHSHIFSILVAPISALFLLLLWNVVARKAAPSMELSQADLLVAFSMVWVAGAASAEWATMTHSPLHSLALTADQDPIVRDKMLPNLPEWLVTHDKGQVQDMAAGGLGVEQVVEKLPLFLPKYLAWTAILGLAFGAMFSLNALMRGAWCKTERLSFPLIQLPVAMVESGGKGSMWRSKPMWIAFAIMFGIDMLNGFAFLYPNLPSIPVKEYVNLTDFFPDPPLSNMGMLSISLYPFLAAIGLLIPSDLLFSLILFFFIRKFTHIALAANGISQHTFSGTAISPGAPYFDEQTWGAVLAIFCGAMWFGRGYLRQVWRDVRSGAASDDGGVRHRWTFAILLACFSGLVGIGMLGGFPLWWMVPYVALILIFSAVLSRLRAQLGPPTHEFAHFAANSFLFRLFGNDSLSDKQASFLSTVFFPFNRIARVHPAPFQLEAIKMTRDERLAQRPLFWAWLVAAVLAFGLAFFFLHVVAYRTGNVNVWPEHAGAFRAMTEERHGTDPVGLGMTAFGFLFVFALDALRFRFPGFPIHPGGYVLSMNFGVDYYWFGLLLALGVKTAVTRYGGLPGYAKLRNVAFGILLGEYLAETIWMVMALLTHHGTYTISILPRGF